MSISILEEKRFICDENEPENKYFIGESIVELAKCNLKQLKTFLHTEIPENTTYEKYFKDLFKINYDSIYFKSLKNILFNFYNNFDDSEPADYNYPGPEKEFIPFPYSVINEPNLFKHEMNLFFQPLFNIQDKANKVLLCLSETNDNNKIEKLASLYKEESDLFKIKNIKDSIFYRYDAFLSESTIIINNDIAFKECFSDIESLFFFELKRLLKSKTKIIKCPICKEIYVASDKRQKYCSNKCKNKANKGNKNKNIFYIIYRDQYKRLHSSYYSKKGNYNTNDKILPQEIRIALKTLLNEYISKDQSNSKIIEEYTQKIRAIK